MEHEVFVPVAAERLREALADPARVARAVPGLQQEAGTAPVSGRLKVRVSGHTITYRGTLRVVGQDDGSYSVAADATEARGSGSVKLALTLSLRPAEGGSTLAFDGTATADGRIAELPVDAVASASTRLLHRFAENLAAASDQEAKEAEEAEETEKTEETEETEEAAVAPPEGAQESEPAAAEEPSLSETEVPPPALASYDESDFEGGFEEEAEAEPPAEAAHARRTMIGRSAEEVDHAPPRGRYAPTPAPEAVSHSATLRWAAPAAAFVLASAIVVSRVLRRRR
ncbi:SRPBCC family protein [Streptomyces sporangiiformans]|uniref:Carbon monoxide dehydrogenase n=1 Tax=Streptomyces sporangiiformans TaxID=2315329 RepID=A0A505DGH4_9ACTN|nr:SRPBCC family protein [Streptomyces sporangiiformans]TPQ20765.1 carbon monoxide dehydrogenase [Streptomyces sporangiiformans]